ncbi:metal-dependent hydrolase [Desulfonatronum sp. SC1]|uniref:metal-dependent hydrolase n=1 Tax=Desulfonatronum sp. SC1 TaxID=2109626 RepID=UPI000D300F54|nr:metal-dependent hydrolase [Desulfonatronum sp. SC1]PTN35043.1 metal-dependent hydrolase [Desulfonatronum sp. SC1]
MKTTRRQFFQTIGLTVGGVGLGTTVAQAAPEASPPLPKSRKPGAIGIEWLGHGSFLFVSTNGKRILFDPWIMTSPACPGKYKKQGSFSSVDFIVWTHGHVDHFMLGDAKELIETYDPKVIAPWELSFFIKSEIPKANCLTFNLGNKGATADFDGVGITMVEAFHSAGAQLTGFQGTNRFVGEAVGYIFDFENGLRLYHSGDTSLMGDMKTIIGDYYKPDIAILPIGGVFTMGPEEAAHACSMIQPRIVIPEHYATFPVLEQDAERFKATTAKRAPNVEVLELVPGEMVELA